MEDHSWACSEGSTVTGHGLGGAVLGWYLPVLVVGKKQMGRNGVRVVVMVERVAVGKAAGGFEQAMGIRSRVGWHRYKMSRRQLVAHQGRGV